ncbi:Na+/H+ antiporter NhaC [Salsuginibacillus kocurii]|uniref:Na+/H+ antiporter NhaC n=1 Tax=Salsuginibacillus kocurii TaxID=427078 RepID=UPI00036880EA|nr:Na+/H+ antiporter NhaC [Salsuginibacillus kocurii]
MGDNKEKEVPLSVSNGEAVAVILGILTVIGVGLIAYEAPPHVPIFFVVMLLVVYSFVRRVPWRETEAGMIQGIQAGIVPIVIFILIGVLISVWMSAGTIPTFIYYSFQVIDPSIFVASVFVVTAVVGVSIGSSFTTASTIGVSFMTLAAMMDMNLALVAGAVVSGALVGDKMSPLSDTTNLASSVGRVDLFEHIRHMMWTTLPAFVITLLLYLIIGSGGTNVDMSALQVLMGEMHEAQIIHPLSLLPAVVIVILAVRRTPAIPTMLAGIGTGLLVTIFMNPGYSVSEFLLFIQEGYAPATENEELNEMLAQGGIEGMMWPVSLLILTLSMGGMLQSFGLIQQLMTMVQSFVKSSGRLITSTVGTALGINLTLGEQYMSVILTGKAYEERYQDLGLARKNMTRAIENGGTLINAIIPYGVSGVFMASVLEVDVLAFAPFAFFCLLGPILALLYGWTGKSMPKEEGRV